ncbi:MAG: RNA polymerase subunit sigma-70 [Clostridiales bacterium]|nr:RNA polymerase subunit sigma-70 [Clostridiales bacterium]
MHDDIYQMYLEEVGRLRACTLREEQQLLARMREGDEAARQRLLEGSLKFVLELAREYDDRGVMLGDLVQEANLALMLTAESYEEGDFRAQVRARAGEMIEEAIQAQGRERQAGEEMLARVNVLQKVAKMMADEQGSEPSVEELAARMKMTPDEIRMIMKETLDAMSVSPWAEE